MIQEKEKYTGNSKAEENCRIKECINLVNRVTKEDIRNQIRDLGKQCQVGQIPEDSRLGKIIERIYEGLKQWPDQTSFYQIVLKSYPRVYEKDKDLKEKGLI